jgi:uncharacterized membrane protein
MFSKIKIACHPVHPMIIAYPVAFYTTSLVCFLVYASDANLFWFKVAAAANGAGIVMAIVAALLGFIDWLGIPVVIKAKRVGLNQMLCNVGALIFFAVNFFMQYKKLNDPAPNASPAIPLTTIGLILTVTAGFLGWSLIQNHRIGISLTEEQKRLDPPDGVKSN